MKKLLIANRGEIALRIIRTCRRLGIKTVAVYSDLDLGAPHVKLADEAYRIGGESAEESYLRSDAIVAVAKQAGAEAIHPGYGFLAEDADFAAKVENAGLRFVGPSAATMRLLGRKDRARALAKSLKIPTPPGYQGEEQAIPALEKAAQELGFPLMIKAAAGGGGRGMRRVEHPDELTAALESSKREAGRFFGDDTLFLERLITRARHIEVQVIGDTHGKLLHLFERDCSIQRRFQKIIEEGPAAQIAPELLEKLRRYALLLAKEGKLHNAATFEFLVAADGSGCWFLEANTRLQVEHPVTEAITGLDLVELQIRVAEGKALEPAQADVRQNGFAIETRIYAEVPYSDSFLPTSGQIRTCKFPRDIRVDHALSPGLELNTEYDPLLAKVIATGLTQHEARENLYRALLDTHLAGVGNNIPYLLNTVETLLVPNTVPTTDFIEQNHARLFRGSDSERFVDYAALLYLIYEQLHECEKLEDAFEHLRRTATRWEAKLLIRAESPDNSTFEVARVECLTRQSGACSGIYSSSGGQEEFSVSRTGQNNVYRVRIGIRDEEELTILEEGLSASARPRLIAAVRGHTFEVSAAEEGPSIGVATGEIENQLRASLPGTVVRVLTTAGDEVVEGQTLVILESMKMEHKVTAPRHAIVQSVEVKQADSIRTGDVLVTLDSRDVG